MKKHQYLELPIARLMTKEEIKEYKSFMNKILKGIYYYIGNVRV